MMFSQPKHFLHDSTIPLITVSPSEALVDQRVSITVRGLSKNQPITIHASLAENDICFASCACYTADSFGNVDVESMSSSQGTYTGKGPFPGIVDLFGTSGGLTEFRASLLASHGFAVLALAYLQYDDLPPLDDLDLSYFEDGVNWLLANPKVISDGVGVIGVSKGAEIALVMGTYLPKVRAVININGPPHYTMVSIRPPGQSRNDQEYDVSKAEFTDEGLVFSNCYRFTKDQLIPVWNGDAKYLMIVGDDDKCFPFPERDVLYDAIPEDRNLHMEVVHYHGAGHLIEPPYSPFCRASYHSMFGTIFVWGGSSRPHAFAQEDSWRRIQDFFHNNLQPKKNCQYSNERVQ